MFLILNYRSTLTKSTIFVLPSFYEGHPKALLEAMSCGAPVLGADSPGIRELIRHGNTGYLCGTDLRSIRVALEELLSSPDAPRGTGKQCAAIRGGKLFIGQDRKYGIEYAKRGRQQAIMPRNYLFQFVSRVIKALLSRLPDEELQNVLIDAASTRARKLSPARGLRFLFGLDAALYPLQGRLSVEYDGGIHTKHRHTRYHDFFVQRVRKVNGY